MTPEQMLIAQLESLSTLLAKFATESEDRAKRWPSMESFYDGQSRAFATALNAIESRLLDYKKEKGL